PGDHSLPDRCLTLGLPEFGAATGSTRRIVQTPGGITIFYDVGQGQGWQRNIIMDGRPHLPASIRQWYGDSRGHWEGNTLVIDVTNFSPKTDYQGSRENLHLVERWTRTSPPTLEYVVSSEARTMWTRPWTAKQESTSPGDQGHRVRRPARGAPPSAVSPTSAASGRPITRPTGTCRRMPPVPRPSPSRASILTTMRGCPPRRFLRSAPPAPCPDRSASCRATG